MSSRVARTSLAVRSEDGTPITFVRSGSGSPILLIHGGGDVGNTFAFVARELARTHTVLVMDRRGRSRPIDPGTYALEIEFADVLAVAADAHEPVHVLGHSYGGLCAIGAAAAHPELFRAVTLYEPPIPTEDHPYATAADLAALEDALTGGRVEEGALLAMRGIVGLTEQEIDDWRAMPEAWRELLDRSHVLRWEMPTVARYRLDPQTLERLPSPVTMLLGEHSPRRYRASADALASHLPSMRRVVLPGQGHAAMATAPLLLAEAIVEADARARSDP